MSAKTDKEFLIEYPIDISYAALLDTFPVKYYRMVGHDNNLHTVDVYDFSNRYFTMRIYLDEYTPNSTLVHFKADYTNAVSDIGSGGEHAIYTVLEAFLQELDKNPKQDFEELDSDIEIVDPKTFINPMKNKSDTITIVLGYIFCILSFIIPIFSYFFFDREEIFIISLISVVPIGFCLGLTASILLQLSENSKSNIHGKIQTCLCGLIMILLGIYLHYFICILGVIVPLIVFSYIRNRNKF